MFGLEHGPRRGDRGVAGKREVVPSLVDIASSAERLSKLIVSGVHTKPISSDLARACTAEIATAVATDKATLDDSVRLACVKLSYKDVSHISVLRFSSSLNKSDGTQQLTHSVGSAMSDILIHCDDRCTESARAPTRVTGWTHPLKVAFKTPDKHTTARITTMLDDGFVQVSRAMDDGASGPEAFTLLLRLLVTHFDPVDMGEGYTKLHTFGVCNGTPFFQLGGQRAGIDSHGGCAWFLSGNGCGVGGGSDGGNKKFPILMSTLTLYPGSKATHPRPLALLDAMWRAYSGLAHNNTPAGKSK